MITLLRPQHTPAPRLTGFLAVIDEPRLPLRSAGRSSGSAPAWR